MANFGETLKREREQRDIPLRDIANATKINLRYLEALEQNRFDILPGGVFNKGFIRAYARFIGADGEALVQRYVEEMTEREALIAGTTPTPDKPGMARSAPAPRRRDNVADEGSGAGPAITLGEKKSAAAPSAPGAAPRTHPDRAPAAATMSFRSADEPFPQARLLLAGTTVIAAFAALGTVFYLVRSARQVPLASPSRQEAPATAPETMAPAGTDPAPSESTSPSESEANPATPDTVPPAGAGGAEPGSAAPKAKPETRPLPEVPRERDGTLSPVRVASPIPAPVQEPVKPPKSAPSSPPVVAPSPATAPATAPAIGTMTPPPPRATGPMSIVVQATTPTTVILGCDGAERPARTMLAGESLTLRCYSLVRISAEDAGAVRLSLDGVPCPALGSSGSRVEHFTIRAEDARSICPPAGGTAGHGRR
jgi:cytoskeletal protein RodZ